MFSIIDRQTIILMSKLGVDTGNRDHSYDERIMIDINTIRSDDII